MQTLYTHSILFTVVDTLLEEQPLIVSGLKIILNEPSLKVCYNWSNVMITIVVNL